MIILKEKKDSEREEFSDAIVEQAFGDAGGKCVKCSKQLVWENRGRENGRGCWEAHHGPGGRGDNSLGNCLIYCWECHKETLRKKAKLVLSKKLRIGIRTNKK